MRGLPSNLSLFRNGFHKLNNTGALTLSSRFHWIFVFDNLIGMTVSVGNASSKRFQMETYIKSKSDF